MLLLVNSNHSPTSPIARIHVYFLCDITSIKWCQLAYHSISVLAHNQSLVNNLPSCILLWLHNFRIFFDLRSRMILPLASSIAAAPVRSLAQRQLSMACAQSVEKLHSILEEYRSTNYAQELPNRFRKDIIKAATSTSSRQFTYSATPTKNALVTAEGIENVLKNIGQGHRMSRAEIEFILREVGGASRSGEPESCVISADQMMELMSMRKIA